MAYFTKQANCKSCGQALNINIGVQYIETRCSPSSGFMNEKYKTTELYFYDIDGVDWDEWDCFCEYCGCPVDIDEV